MTVDELNSVQRLKAEIYSELENLESLKTCAETLAISKVDGLPHAKVYQSQTEKFVIKKMESEKRLSDLSTALMNAYNLLTATIETKLKDKPMLQVVARYRFLVGNSVAEISARLNYSQRHVFKLQQQVVKLLIDEK